MVFQKKHNKKCFTLVEMLIVVIIIGILAGSMVPRLISIQQRTRDAIRQVALRDISNAIEAYATDNEGFYPKASFIARNNNNVLLDNKDFLSNLYKNIGPAIWHIENVFAAGTSSSIDSIKGLLNSYLSKVPTDPKNGLETDNVGVCIEAGKSFSYYTNNSGTMYAISSIMETQKGNTSNCKGDIDKNGDGKYIVVGKGLNDTFHPATPSGWYDGIGDPYERCKKNMSDSELADLNNLIVTFSGNPQQLNNRCELQNFSIQNGTFGIVNPSNQNAGAKIEIPVGFNKLAGLKTLDLSAGVINIAHFTFPMYFLTSIHLDGNKHLKDLILPNTFPNLEEFVLQDSLLSSISFPSSAPLLKKINIFDTNLQVLNLPTDLSNLVEIRINNTKLQTIFLPANMPSLQVLNLKNNKFVAPLPSSTCTLLESKGRTTSNYIDNYNKLCK